MRYRQRPHSMMAASEQSRDPVDVWEIDPRALDLVDYMLSRHPRRRPRPRPPRARAARFRARGIRARARSPGSDDDSEPPDVEPAHGGRLGVLGRRAA
jgi:hypothetical protein